MRNALPLKGPRPCESAIINLDDADRSGTHWVAYTKLDDDVIYFDSFGDLQPPTDLMEYLGNNVGSVKYNHQRYQNFNGIECGHLCLKFLCNQLHTRSPYKLVLHSVDRSHG